MYEDPSARLVRAGALGGQRGFSRLPAGHLGRVGTAAVAAGSVSSERRVRRNRCGTRRDGEPALGVMGGPLQSVSSPAVPPVSSLSGRTNGSTTTAPAPRDDVQAGDVSPRAAADATTAVDVEPTPAQVGRRVIPDDPDT